jgi:hypothetical protein
MPTYAQLQQIGVFLATLVLSFYAVTKALAGLLGFIGGAWYPPAVQWGAAVNRFASEVHLLGERIGGYLPASATRMAAKRAAVKLVPPAAMLLLVVGLGASLLGCSLFAAGSPVQQDSQSCATCAGGDVIANYTSGAPVPFYPQLVSKIETDCSASCGADVVAIIESVSASADARVQATPAFAEAVSRRNAMLAGADPR